MKTQTCLNLVLAVVFGSLCLSQPSAFAKYGGGSGTAEDPYQIWTHQQMNLIGINTEDMGKQFKLMADIDMSAYTGTQYNVIGNVSNKFSGTFDGDGHVISNLTYSTSSAFYDVGVFGRIAGATIKNLGARNVSITSNGGWIGGLVGRNESGTVSGCFVTGAVKGQYDTGGLVGWNQGSIVGCYSGCSVTTTYSISAAGGLAGTNDGSIATCYATGRVNGNNAFLSGGLVGMGNGSVSASFWDTQTSGYSYSAGGTGKTTAEMKTLSTFTDAEWDFTDTDGDAADWWMPSNSYPRLAWEYPYGPGGGTAEDPYQIWTPKQMNGIGLNPADWDKHFILMADLNMAAYTGTQYNRIGTGLATPFTGTFEGNGHVVRNLTYSTTAAQDFVGLFGYVHEATIRNLGVENAALSTHGSFVGGVAGHKTGTITGCYASGSFSGSWAVGGVVGNNESGLVENCYATGSVTGTGQYAGGLVGRFWIGTLSHCYSTVKVVGAVNVGAFVGWNFGGLIDDSFWDTQTSGQNTGVGLGDATGLFGKPTIELKKFATFASAGWDFANAWGIANYQSYPYLKWLTGFNPADLNFSGAVDMEDLAMVAANWMK